MVALERGERRVIYEVSHATLARMTQSLPTLPADVAGWVPIRGKQRSATAAELDALRWFVAFDRDRIVGIAATLDRFDYPSLVDVRELVHIAGTKRAVGELLRHVIGMCDADEKPLYGAFNRRNARGMQHAIQHGCEIERIVLAYGKAR